MKPWEIQRKRAEKRRREEARRERKKNPRAEPGRFRLVKVGGAGAGPEVIVASVIVKNPDESVFEAGFDELEPGMALVLEDEKGLIQKGIVEEKVPSASEEELPVLTVRIV